MESAWDQLTRNISNCRVCKAIAETKSRPVLGTGSIKAKIIIVGLAPGKDGADLTGIPFTRDPSGELFNQMLTIAGLSRDQDVFVTNLVKCNPKDASGRNRSPSKEETKNCFPFLKREIEYLKPRIIVTLGRPATRFLMNVKIDSMKKFHGITKLKEGMLFFPFFHPSYVIRGAYDKEKYLEEFKVLGNAFRDFMQEESRLSRLDILLLLLKNSSESGLKGLIRGKTKLQKLLFLVQRELLKKGYKAKYAFRPYFYGPYSRELYTDIEWLKASKLIDVKTHFNDKIGVTTEFIITDEGKQRLNLIDPQIYRNIEDIITEVTAKYEHLNLAQLVEFVHNNFSNYSLSYLEKNRKQVKLDSFVSDKEI